MRKHAMTFALLAAAGIAWSMEPVHPPGLLPTDIARPLLAQDPSVAAARAGLEVAQQEAGILDGSPYEWNAKLSSQRRAIQNGPNFNEWNVAIERPLRLPAKAAADRRHGKATIEAAEAAYGEALHEAARELIALWVNWLVAEHAHALTQNDLKSVEDNLAAVDKRQRAGDASKLDVNVARAERAEQRRLDNDAKTQAAVAWSRLSVRFPGFARNLPALPVALPISEDVAAWRERILAQSDELKIAQTRLQKAQALADRARADQIPDPTLGLYTASEFQGRERINGITISIPIPGGARDARDARAAAAVTVARHEVEAEHRRLEAEIAGAVASALGTHESLRIAGEGAQAMQQNAQLMQRAYALGEADLQTLLLARRQASSAAANALQEHAAALKAYYGLLVDAHLIWYLDHD